LQQHLFDFVIFDEASQLRLEDTYASMIRGRYKIVSGDTHQMPPSNYFGAKVTLDGLDTPDTDEDESDFSENDSILQLADSESLLSYAESSGYRYSPLDIHYRSRNPDLINFSNAAFYGNRLLPMPNKDAFVPISFYAVDGAYETNNGVNEDEAYKAVEILKSHINDFKKGTYTSVGIATLNISQRNKILEFIREEAECDYEFATIIDQLSATKDFFVKNLENIQGDEKDIIILSTTFGVNQNGGFIQNFGPLNQEKGYKLLNVIITRAKHKMYVCTSIPADYYLNYSEEIKARGNIGKGIFYAYLAYAKAVSDADSARKDAILSLLQESCNENVIQTDRFTESVFEEEVVSALSEHLDSNRIILQHKIGGFRIDIAIPPLSGNGKWIAIECDGASYHTSPVAYSWDLFRQKQLEQHNFIFYRIWSSLWWENPEEEIKKLLAFIESVHGAAKTPLAPPSAFETRNGIAVKPLPFLKPK